MPVLILLLLLGLVLIVLGAEILVGASSDIARKAGISEFAIGMVLLGMGTSLPELVVSLTGAIEGCADIAIGNVIGSNLFNVLLILGITALIIPIDITERNLKKDIPLNMGITFLMILLGMNASIFHMGQNNLSRIDGIILLLIFICYMIYSFKSNEAPARETKKSRDLPVAISVTAAIAGLLALVAGGRLFVNEAVELAGRIGVSQKFIAITILAGGTSLPELATCIVAAARKKGQLALGNIIGSNIFNILLILGVSSTIVPLSAEAISRTDMGVLLVSSIVLLTSCWTFKRKLIDKGDGIVFISIYALYMLYLFLKA